MEHPSAFRNLPLKNTDEFGDISTLGEMDVPSIEPKNSYIFALNGWNLAEWLILMGPTMILTLGLTKQDYLQLSKIDRTRKDAKIPEVTLGVI